MNKIIGIGFRRCGTSHMHSVLNTSKYITKCPSGSHYFSNQLNYFVLNDNYNFDLSVTYGYPENTKKVIHNIKEYCLLKNLNPKLFCIMRDPVERFFSDIVRSIKIGEFSVNESLRNIIFHNSSFLLRGKYSLILDEYNRNSLPVKIFKLDELKNDPMKFWVHFFRFCDLDIPIDDINSFLNTNKILKPKRNYSIKNIRNALYIRLRTYYNKKYSKALHEISNHNFREELTKSLRRYYKREYSLYFST